jgi:hypothetical protein
VCGRLEQAKACQILPLPVLIPKQLVWDLIKPVRDFALNFNKTLIINNEILHSVCGRLEEAKALLARGLPILELKFGLESARVASCLNNLATVHIQRCAEALLTNPRPPQPTASERVLGSLHPDPAVTLSNLLTLAHTHTHMTASSPWWRWTLSAATSRPASVCWARCTRTWP